jgi:hypothetical protein
MLSLPSSFTVTAKVKVTAFSQNYMGILSKGALGNEAAYNFLLGIHVQKPIIWVGDGASAFSCEGNALTLNKEYHLAGWFTSGSLRMYVDGALVKSGAGPTTATTNTDPLTTGAYYSGGYWLTGVIKETRAFNRALTQSEITALYNGQG